MKFAPAEPLSPCPFCGGRDIYTDDSSDCSATPVVGCFGCDAHIIGESTTDVVAKWNRRASPSPAAVNPEGGA